MQNIPATAQEASFRGVPFFVDVSALSGAGHHVAVSEYVKSDDWSTEDMGMRSYRRKIRADLYGATVADDLEALREAAIRRAPARSSCRPGAGRMHLRPVRQP